METEKYFEEIEKGLKNAFEAAGEARKKGFDPEEKVEILLTRDMAERVEKLISVVAPQIIGCGVVERIKELESQYGLQDWRVALTISEEIARQKFCKFNDEREAMEVGLRTGFAYLTNGVVASPLEGFVRLGLKDRQDGKKYFCIYFSGPVRSAGTTATCVFVCLCDYVRKKMGYKEYDPTKEEIKRMSTELYDFHEKVANLQYLPSVEEIEFMIEKLPVQIDGDASEKYEVSNYKDLKRIETNKLRNGVCLTIGEGLTQKAAKFWGKFSKWYVDFDMKHWAFIEDFVNLQKKIKARKKTDDKRGEKISPDYTYIKDLVAGRPILSYPLRKGGLRLRLGRCRNTGLSSTALHPATMLILNKYIAIGTQLRVERPGKATTLASCDSIEGPIVKLRNGSVVFVETEELAKKILNEVEEIIYIGDILVPYGDFLNRAHVLVPPGYCEEWWMLEANCDRKKISVDEAIEFCKKEKPLHPRYTYHWTEINKEQFFSLIEWLKKGKTGKEIVLPLNYDIELVASEKDPKRVLELIGVPHRVEKDKVIIEEEWAKALMFSLGGNLDIKSEKQDVLEIVNEISKAKIRDKSGLFIGARMGRPEKAKMRKMTGTPHILFPVGTEGGRLRSFQSALDKGKIKAQFPIYYCENCKKETIYSMCESCNRKTIQMYYCTKSDKTSRTKGHTDLTYKTQSIDIKHYFDSARNLLNITYYPELIKGVRGTSNETHIPEHLAKGIIRAMHGLYINKDGTARYDMTETVITHFKPKEIGTSIAKLKSLGYDKDIHGKELENEEQLLEIKPQDIILPSSNESLDEKADDFLFNVCGFIDDLLVKLYKLKPFYNLNSKKDLVGVLVIGLSPHTSAGIVLRVIGFSGTQGFYAHPYVHSIMRRDCLSYDSYITIKDKDNLWKIEKIGDFIEKNNPKEKADIYGTLKKKVDNHFVWGNPGKCRIKEITKHAPRKLLRLYLECGRKIELTGSHKVYLKGKKEKEASNLNIGDKLMVNYKKNIKGIKFDTIFLPDLFQDRGDIMIRNINSYLSKLEKINKHINFYQRDSFPIKYIKEILKRYNKSLMDLPSSARISVKRDNVLLPLRIKLDKKLLEVMGLYIAEGYARKNNSKKGFYQISISSKDNKIKNLIKKVFYSHFYINPSWENQDSVTYSSKILYELFTDHLKFGGRAKNKRIPPLFLNLEKKKLASLLRGYFEGDGSVSKTDIRVCCDTISEGLKHDLSFALSRFGIFTKFYDYEKEPGLIVKEFYLKKKREVPKFKITKIIIPSNFVKKFAPISFLSRRKKKIFENLCNCKPYGMKIDFDERGIYPKIVKIEELNEEPNYCLNVENEHNFLANDILVHNCDGDEAGILLLMDALINFSLKYLPAHRGARQDEPLILSTRIIPREVDDMVFDMDICWRYPLELYQACCDYKMPWDVKIKRVKDVLNTSEEYSGFGFTHDTSNINDGVRCSAYKSIPSMQEKVQGQMDLAEKIRAVDESDVANLVIERHFIRDIKGNLRKFSTQQFRCVNCNEKFRRPPLMGVCTKCNGRLIFTVAEGSVVKYLEPSLFLAEKYDLSHYLKQTLELTKQRIESVFGKAKEKQEGLGKWS